MYKGYSKYSIERSLENAALLEIECLFCHTDLQNLGQKIGLKCSGFEYLQEFKCERIPSKKQSEEDEYEVEAILDYTIVQGHQYYLIKWKNFDDSYNTWEPGSNLKHCKVLRKKFDEQHALQHPFKKIYNFFVQHGVRDCPKQYISTEDGAFGITLLKELLKIPDHYPKTLPKLYQFVQLQVALKQWEEYINRVVGHEQIIVENEVDFETPPKNFTFINDYVPGINVTIVNEPPLGCTCPNNCQPTTIVTPPTATAPASNSIEEAPSSTVYLPESSGNSYQDQRCARETKNPCESSEPIFVSPNSHHRPMLKRKKNRLCCSYMSGSRTPYNRSGRVVVPAGQPIYECNKLCRCDPALCQSRVVQRGNGRFKFAIYKTRDKGWAVRPLQRIFKNTFVMEYIGEVITNEEAEQRGLDYDLNGITYLFDLDFSDQNNAFTIDAGHFGNISHFVNHSCDPNLVIYAVYINNLDIRMPRIALFSKRDIEKDEELTFDYLNSAHNNYNHHHNASQLKSNFGLKSPINRKSTTNLPESQGIAPTPLFNSHMPQGYENPIMTGIFKDSKELNNILTPPPSFAGSKECQTITCSTLDGENESLAGMTDEDTDKASSYYTPDEMQIPYKKVELNQSAKQNNDAPMKFESLDELANLLHARLNPRHDILDVLPNKNDFKSQIKKENKSDDELRFNVSIDNTAIKSETTLAQSHNDIFNFLPIDNEFERQIKTENKLDELESNISVEKTAIKSEKSSLTLDTIDEIFNQDLEKGQNLHKNRIVCKCRSKNCRKYIF